MWLMPCQLFIASGPLSSRELSVQSMPPSRGTAGSPLTLLVSLFE